MLIHTSFRKRFLAKSLNIFSRSMLLTMPFSIDNIAKLFSLSWEIFDLKYVLTSFKIFFHLMQLLQALLSKSSKQ